MTTQKVLNYRKSLTTKKELFDSENQREFIHTFQPVFFNTSFDKNQLKTLIAWFLNSYGEKITVDLLETLKEIGFHQATLAGVSLGIDDLLIPAQKPFLISQALVKIGELANSTKKGNITSVEKSQRLIDTWNQTSEVLRQTAVQNFRLKNPVNPVFIMAFSGARGNISQVRQLVGMRGLMADPQGAILEFPIQSNFREGLTITEYLISCYGARKGLVDTALRTATSGYLTRRLVDAVQHVVIVMRDCKTTRGLLLKHKNFEKRLIGRILLKDLVLESNKQIKKNTLISASLAKQIVKNYKQIYVRSPLTCNTEKSVCQLCYGLNLAQGKLVSIGEAVGVIAAQSIGEPGTQLTMRTFHTGGVGVFSDGAMKSFYAPFEGKIQFIDTLPGLFVRTPHGQIVYLLKHNETVTSKTTGFLRIISDNSKNIYEIAQNLVPSGSILWVKEGEPVKTGDLLIQASRIKTSKQQMPESSHPVPAPFSGQIYFESMAIRVVKKQTQNKIKKAQKKENEISPNFRTLTRLGNFWLFSSFIQKQDSVSKSFFIKGDLLSQETPIAQYNLTIPRRGKLQTLNERLILARPSMNLIISQIYYLNLCYYFIKKQPTNCFKKTGLFKTTIIVSTNNPHEKSFTWYPVLDNFKNLNSGYYSILPVSNLKKRLDLLDPFIKNTFNPKNKFSETGQIDKKNFISSVLEKTAGFAQNQPDKGFLLDQSRIFFSEQNIYRSKNLVLFLQQTSFLINTVSRTGTFLFVFYRKIFWEKNTFVRSNFRKNNRFAKNKIGRFSISSLCPKFMAQGLALSEVVITQSPEKNLIKKKQEWFYIPNIKLEEFVNSTETHILLEPGKLFETIVFEKCFVSINVLKTTTLYFTKSKQIVFSNRVFYSKKGLLGLDWNKTSYLNKKISKFFPKDYSLGFSFYKKRSVSLPTTELDGRSFCSTLNFHLKRKKEIPHVLYFQKNASPRVPDLKYLKQYWLTQNEQLDVTCIKSPLFTKQTVSAFEQNQIPTHIFSLASTPSSKWGSLQTLLKIQIQSKSLFKNYEQVYCSCELSLSTLPPSLAISKKRLAKINMFFCKSLAFTFLTYTSLKIQTLTNFSFQTFKFDWVIPKFTTSKAFLKSHELGEFRQIQKKKKSLVLSILRKADLTAFDLTETQVKRTKLLSGGILRWGDELFPNRGLPINGQILKVSSKKLIVRKGVPILASSRGVIHIFHKDLIKKNDLLITLKSRRLQTEDIVQGIPKIEQLFEARETQGGEVIHNSAQTQLQNVFQKALQFKSLPIAVNQSIHKIQLFLVDNILEAYSNQGVTIADKHVEIVVRQMTARVRILSGGDTGLLPGEIVQLKWIERVNKKFKGLGSRCARYEPMILGITKSVLQSESFLVAASFQEVSRVLVRSALSKKTDFLRGLHENVILGQLLPAGTGIISRKELQTSFSSSNEQRSFVPPL